MSRTVRAIISLTAVVYVVTSCGSAGGVAVPPPSHTPLPSSGVGPPPVVTPPPTFPPVLTVLDAGLATITDQETDRAFQVKPGTLIHIDLATRASLGNGSFRELYGTPSIWTGLVSSNPEAVELQDIHNGSDGSLTALVHLGSPGTAILTAHNTPNGAFGRPDFLWRVFVLVKG
jgi:hypothetical protein